MVLLTSSVFSNTADCEHQELNWSCSSLQARCPSVLTEHSNSNRSSHLDDDTQNGNNHSGDIHNGDNNFDVQEPKNPRSSSPARKKWTRRSESSVQDPFVFDAIDLTSGRGKRSTPTMNDDTKDLTQDIFLRIRPTVTDY
jgi:hypothetical protein